jgi:hypothetical protein
MKAFIGAAALFMTGSLWANLHLAPPDFDTNKGRAIFVDFKTADYQISYDLKSRTTTVVSKIRFEAHSSGTPLFDLVPMPSKVVLDGNEVEQRSIALPGGVSTVRQLTTSVGPGEHTLEIVNTFKKNTLYVPVLRYVKSAFWIRDLKDRMFLEQYLPSNFEFDQYKMTMEIHFKGNRHEQEIFTNGTVTKLSNDDFKIDFPEYFTSSALYFHTAPKGWMIRRDFTYRSVSGRDIPITVYSHYKSRTRKLASYSKKIMAELEADYGPWAHPSFVAYGTFPGTGGMEHSGATATSLAALDHEMLHSYFAKGVMPANGNSGWIDEAIAAWRDNGYPRSATPGFEGSNIGAHSPYQRQTDSRSYRLGAAFMGHMDWKLQDLGGLKAFLKGYFHAYKHTVITTEHFKNNLEFFSGLDLTHDFETLIWGKNTPETQNLSGKNPVHGTMSERELRSLL